MIRGNRRWLDFAAGIALLLAVVVCAQAKDPPSTGQDPTPAQEVEQTFALQEVSVFDPTGPQMEFRYGQTVPSSEAADANIVAYPAFQSQHPLYGALMTYLPKGHSIPATYRFAIDESGGTGQGYDRLYFDLNRNNSLTDDEAIAAQKNPPARALDNPRDTPQVLFGAIALPFPFGAQGKCPIEVLPRLMIPPGPQKLMCFIATKARQGQIRIGARQYDALLAHGFQLTGWFDQPQTTLYLTSGPGGARWNSGYYRELAGTYNIGGTFCRFSATPAGDKLTVRSYTGPLGIFEMGRGGRKIGGLTMSGLLRSATTTVPVGVDLSDNRELAPARSCQLPVGDYQLCYLTVQIDGLRVMILNNAHVDGKRAGKAEPANTSGIAIRADKPFVLEFSHQPQVLFVWPARAQRVKLGEELKIQAVLIDKALDVMFRHLTQEKQLDPKVIIKRAHGEIVAQGTMPFG